MFEDTMKMNRNIKITESQYRMLQEADEEMFPYVTDNDAKPFNGYGDISADGKKSGEENADEKTTMVGIGIVHMAMSIQQLLEKVLTLQTKKIIRLMI